MHALFDTGSNITLQTRRLAKQLRLHVQEYTSTFQVASGAGACFVGWPLRTRLQLHDFLAYIVESIQVIN